MRPQRWVRILLYWLAILGIALASWLMGSRRQFEFSDLITAVAFAGLAAYLVWYRWDVAAVLGQRRRLLAKRKRRDR